MNSVLKKFLASVKTRVNTAHGAWFLLLGLLLFVGVVYGPYLTRGTLIIDDWAIAETAVQHPGIVASYHSLFSQFSNRPLAPLFLSLISNGCAASTSCYSTINSIVWLGAISIISLVLKRILSKKSAIIFFLLGSTPLTASTVLFSPAVMFMGSVSLLFWAGSLFFLHAYILHIKRLHLGISIALVALSILTYEATLPLLTINMLLPLYFDAQKEKRGVRFWCAYSKKFVFPILSVLFLIFLYQKIGAPLLASDISRIRSRGLLVIPAAASKFIFLLFADLPSILLRTITRLQTIPFGTWLGIGTAFLLLGRYITSSDSAPTTSTAPKKYYVVWLFAIGATLGMYWLAGTLPTIYGYDNRGLIGFTIALSFLAAEALGRAELKKAYRIALMSAACLYIAAFIIQREQFITAGEIQKMIRADMSDRLVAMHITPEETVFVNIPTYLKENFANESIFSDEQDAVVGIGTPRGVHPGIMLTRRRLLTERAVINPDGSFISDNRTGMTQKSWLYEYTESHGASLRQIKNPAELNGYAALIKESDPPKLPPDPWFSLVRWYQRNINWPPIDTFIARYQERWRFE